MRLFRWQSISIQNALFSVTPLTSSKKKARKPWFFSKGADSVDFALVNLVNSDDIVITQDYGLAAMCLARGARPLSQDGMEYTAEDIDSLLLARHTAKKIRNSGGRLKDRKSGG